MAEPHKKALPAPLRDLLSSYTFAGVRIAATITDLHRAFTQVPGVSVVDLGSNSAATESGNSRSDVVKWATKKPSDERPATLPWDTRPLPLNQIEYAALRVLAPLLVVQAMAEQGYLLPTFTALNGSKSAQQKELALTSLMPSDWRGGPLPLSLQSLVGTNIRKPFKTSHGVGWFCGVVANAKAGGVYKVKYTDGDFEDIYPEDVKLWKQMEPATYAHPAVGKVVQKTFNGKQYTGRVMFVADDLYRVWYPEDGDAEDLTLDEFDRLTVVASTIPQPEATTDAADPKRTQLGEGGTASPTVGPGGRGRGGIPQCPLRTFTPHATPFRHGRRRSYNVPSLRPN